MPTKKQIAEQVVSGLEQIYPEAKCSLNYTHPYELMIAGRLSAQCTDARVNVVTKELFEKYPSLKSFADADIDEVAEIVRPCGLYKTKAKSIVEMAHQLYYDLNGVI
ncbi:MAG: endonuclease III domain-containing protein, partial [Huintestinicola sp.]